MKPKTKCWIITSAILLLWSICLVIDFRRVILTPSMWTAVVAWLVLTWTGIRWSFETKRGEVE